MITYDDFKKLDMRIGTIKAVKVHPEADKLYILLIAFDEEPDKQVVAGLREHYKEDELIGKQVVVLINLEPIKLRGIESNGMILAAVNRKDKAIIISPAKKIENNSKVH